MSLASISALLDKAAIEFGAAQDTLAAARQALETEMPLMITCGGIGPTATPGVIVTVVGGGGTPENGFGSEGYFLAGEEVAATNFFSSAYDAQYHTANGIEVPDEDINYAPQLTAAIVDLLEQENTIVLDGSFTATGTSSTFGLTCDEDTYFQAVVDQFGAYYIENSAQVGVDGPLTAGRYRVVVTKTDGSVSISVNGGAVITDVGDAMPHDPIATVVLNARSGGKITEFTIMSPVTDGAEMMALSALT